MTGKELAQLAKQASGAKTAADLARLLGLESYESPRRVARWLRGANEPDFASTLKLLELIGYPSLDSDAEVLIPPLQDADATARLAQLEKQQAHFARVLSAQTKELHELVAQQKDVLELLGRLAALAERPPTRARRGARVAQ